MARAAYLLAAYFLTIALLVVSPIVSASPATPPALDDYLPGTAQGYDERVPKPAEVLGFEVGEWHVRHDLLVAYMRAVAAASERVTLTTTGHTYEQRPQLLLTITSPSNHGRLESIRNQHLALSDPAVARPQTAAMPVVVHLGYSIHGDEASGSNAALVVAYHLAAAQGPEIDALLDDTVVLLDPSLNPDGLARFAQWANMHRGAVLVGDPAHREHAQGFPSGRTNHYWFDLNRDWLLAQHPESRSRLETFHRWRPNVHTDAHEMGSNNTYFFQPGVPIRRHPLTPIRNQELTAAIAAFHAEAFDRQGRLYYSEETFDDFYYGKGSTYPDAHGSIGILFEQASARGHLQKTDNGDLTFPFAIQNQITTSFSTLAAASAHRQALLDYQADFYRNPFEDDGSDGFGAYVFGDGDDPMRAARMLDILLRHRIVVRPLSEEVELENRHYAPGQTWVVDATQPQRRLIKALFERRTVFDDPTFYDVSAWTLPLAFGLPYAEVSTRTAQGLSVGEPLTEAPAAAGQAPSLGIESAVALAFDWDGYYAPRALYRLLAAGAQARVATESFEAETGRGRRAFARGTVVVPRGLQSPEHEAAINEALARIPSTDGVDVHALTGGLTPAGIDLGSPSLRPLVKPLIALVVGNGVSMYQAGEIWHLLDERFHMPVTLLEKRLVGGTDLSRYSHLVMVGGLYDDFQPVAVEAMRRWLRAGGVLVTTKNAVSWADRTILNELDPNAGSPSESALAAVEAVPEAEPPTPRPYAELDRDRAQNLVAGAIFEASLDTTHPLAYGYREPLLAFFRTDAETLPPHPDAYGAVARYTDAPLLSGYASDENQGRIAGTPAITAQRVGAGLAVRMADNPAFRAYWHATNKLFLNSLFFGSVVRDTRERGR